MHSCVQALLQKIHDTIISNGSEKPARINIYQWIQATAIDVIGETAFGGSFNVLEKGDHPLPKKIFEELRMRIIRASFPLLRPFLPQDAYTEKVSMKGRGRGRGRGRGVSFRFDLVRPTNPYSTFFFLNSLSPI